MPQNALWNILFTALIKDSLNKDFLLNIRCLNLVELGRAYTGPEILPAGHGF